MKRTNIKSDLFIVLVGFFAIAVSTLFAEDWPTFRHDDMRSGISSENLNLKQLRPAWSWQSSTSPNMAWGRPAKIDAYKKLETLPAMRMYDAAFHTIVAASKLYFCSSVDNALHCINANTGKELWRYITHAPLHIAPTFANGKIYFGSDDGFVYCVDAEKGGLIWKFSPQDQSSFMVNNGMLISRYPCRSGVIVQNGIAYFAFSLFRWQPHGWFCAVDAITGTIGKPGTYKRKWKQKRWMDRVVDGPMLFYKGEIVAPCGRMSPMLITAATGHIKRFFNSTGWFMTVSEDGQLYQGVAREKKSFLSVCVFDQKKVLSKHKDAVRVVTAKSGLYILSGKELKQIDKKTNKMLWSLPVDEGCALIMAGGVLFVGENKKVRAIDATTGKELWNEEVSGNAYGLSVADGSLYVSTDQGIIQSFKSSMDISPVLKSAKKKKKTATFDDLASGTKKETNKQITEITLSAPPYIRFTSRNTAEVVWETTENSKACVVWFRKDDKNKKQIAESTLEGKKHTAILTGLNQNTLYNYKFEIDTANTKGDTKTYELDTYFNFTLDQLSLPQLPPQFSENTIFAANTLKEPRGITVVTGCDDPNVMEFLAVKTKSRVIAVLSETNTLRHVQDQLFADGAYGSRVVVYSPDAIHSGEVVLPTKFANTVICFDVLKTKLNVTQLLKILQPNGQALFFSTPESVLRKIEMLKELSIKQLTFTSKSNKKLQCLLISKQDLTGTGVWTHQYGLANNSVYGGETCGGAMTTGKFKVQWFGRPGPSFQVDRNPRKPSPLSAGGRLYVQGNNHFIGIDVYNGSILWFFELFGINHRYNVPRDSSNWCCDNQNLYVAVKEKAWCFSGKTGQLQHYYEIIPGENKKIKYEWGVILKVGKTLIGSAVNKEAPRREYFGAEFKYCWSSDWPTFKVLSDNLFALDSKTGKTLWKYESGLIINSTITASDDKVFFLETRNPELLASVKRRIGGEKLWKNQFLVCLDIKSGKLLFEHAIDIDNGITAIWGVFGIDSNLFILHSSFKAIHSVYAYNADTGELSWHNTFPWGKRDNDKDLGDHGYKLARPAIVGKNIFINPKILDLKTGSVIGDFDKTGRSGCGTYVMMKNAMILRMTDMASLGLWDYNQNEISIWRTLRPGCWISTIPACGMILSPEGGGGCSCGWWTETSVGFIPDD